MVKMPEKFFLVLDAHQAAVVVAFFGMLYSIFFGLFTGYAYHTIGADNISELMKRISDKIQDEQKKHFVKAVPSIVLWSTIVFCIFWIVMNALVLLGVMKRMKRLLLPWLVVQAISTLFEFANLIYGFTDEPTFVSVVMDLVFFLFILGWTAYEFLIVFASYRLLGMDRGPSPIPMY